MKDVIYLLFQLLTTLAKLLRPGGGRAVIAENLILKQQLIIHSRSSQILTTKAVDGSELCRMFNDATSGHGWPKHLSSDNDPLFQYHRWKPNLRVLDIDDYRWGKHCRGIFELPIAV